MLFDGPTFSVKSTLPGPRKKEKNLDTPEGTVAQTFYSFSDPADHDSEQVVQYFTVSTQPGAEPSMRQSAVDGMVANLKATVDDSKTIKVAGTDMLDFSAHWGEGAETSFVRGRVAYRLGRVYQALAIGKGAKPSASANIFIDSFTVK